MSVENQITTAPENDRLDLLNHVGSVLNNHMPQGRNMLKGAGVAGALELGFRLLSGHLSSPDTGGDIVNAAIWGAVIGGLFGKGNYYEAAKLALETLGNRLNVKVDFAKFESEEDEI